MIEISSDDFEIKTTSSGYMEGGVEKHETFDKLIVDCHLKKGQDVQKEITEALDLKNWWDREGKEINRKLEVMLKIVQSQFNMVIEK